MTYHGMPKQTGRMNWQFIFKRWLNDHRVLDRIEFTDVQRYVGQLKEFDYVGPVITLTRE